MADDDYSLAEVVRLLKALREDVNSQFIGFRNEMEDFVLAKVHDAQMATLHQQMVALQREHDADQRFQAARILKLEDGNTWLTRIILGFVAVAVLAAALGAKALTG